MQAELAAKQHCKKQRMSPFLLLNKHSRQQQAKTTTRVFHHANIISVEVNCVLAWQLDLAIPTTWSLQLIVHSIMPNKAKQRICND